jgi:hypothetical protein
MDPINIVSYDFDQFINFVYPSYSLLLNQTKFSLKSQYSIYYGAISLWTIIYYVLQSIIVIMMLFACVYLVKRFYFSMLSIIEIHLQLSENDIFKIKNYNKTIYTMFKRFHHLN